MLSRPEPNSTMPVASVTPVEEPGYGVNVENTSGALPDSDGNVEANTLTCDSIPGPEPTMMLSAMAFPSISAPATVTPPVKPSSKGANRVISVLKIPFSESFPS